MLLLPIGVYLAPPTVQQFCFLEYYNDFTLFFILMLGSLRLAGIVILFTGLSSRWSVLYCRYPFNDEKQKGLQRTDFCRESRIP